MTCSVQHEFGEVLGRELEFVGIERYLARIAVVLNQQVAEAVIDLVTVRRYILSLVLRLAAVVTQQREQYVHQMDEYVVAVRYLL